MRQTIERIARWWCSHTHGVPMTPVRGRYECRKCQRKYTLDWDVTNELQPLRRLNWLGAQRQGVARSSGE